MPPPATTETATAVAASDEVREPTQKIDLSLLDTWKDAAKTDPLFALPKTELQKLTSREAVQSRLRTFLPLTYFCKPASLSPIVCARFGWINTSVDLIKCVSCKAALVIKIHPKITDRSTVVKLIKAYQTKLATTHKEACPFRLEAEMYLVSKDKALQKPLDNTLTVPPHFASILPQDVLEMLEQPKPLPLIRARLHTLAELLLGEDINPSDGEPPQWQLPKLELPEEILSFGTEKRENISNPKQRRMLSKLAFDPHKPLSARDLEKATLLTKLEDILVPHREENEIRAQTRNMDAWEDICEGASALALLGWEPSEEAKVDKAKSKSCVSLHCSICLSHLKFNLQPYDSRHHLRRHHDTVETTDEPPSKRRRTNSNSINPLMSHRCYCPYVCGFPRDGERKTTPIWETVASKLLKNNQQAGQEESGEKDDNMKEAEKDGEAATDHIMQLLQSGVSSRVGKSEKYNAFLSL